MLLKNKQHCFSFQMFFWHQPITLTQQIHVLCTLMRTKTICSRMHDIMRKMRNNNDSVEVNRGKSRFYRCKNIPSYLPESRTLQIRYLFQANASICVFADLRTHFPHGKGIIPFGKIKNHTSPFCGLVKKCVSIVFNTDY
jgi:hypothetical protein